MWALPGLLKGLNETQLQAHWPCTGSRLDWACSISFLLLSSLVPTAGPIQLWLVYLKTLVHGLKTPEWRILCKTRRSEACVKLTGKAPGIQLPWMQKSHSEWGAVQFQSRVSNFFVHVWLRSCICRCSCVCVCWTQVLEAEGQRTTLDLTTKVQTTFSCWPRTHGFDEPG